MKWDEEVARGKEMMKTGDMYMWGMGKLALAVEVKDGFGADFIACFCSREYLILERTYISSNPGKLYADR